MDRRKLLTLVTLASGVSAVSPVWAQFDLGKMLDAGKDVRYYENIEGGHGGAANNAQSAHMTALAYTFLWQQVGKPGAGASAPSGDTEDATPKRRPRGTASGSRL